MEKSKRPNSAAGWAEQIKELSLPLMPNTSAQLITALKQEELAFSKLSALIHRDPIACLYLIKFANQQLKNKDNEITSPDLAISILGMDQVRTIMSKLPTLKLNPKNIAHREYLQSVCNSLHAAAQTDIIAEHKPLLPREALYWGTLFAGTGYWLMWSAAPHEMRIIQYLTFEEHMPMESAQKEILGCTILDISERICEAWNLPSFTRESVSEGMRPSRRQLVKLGQSCPEADQPHKSLGRELKLMINAPAFTAFMGNWLAIESYKSWNGRNFDRAISAYGAFMGISHLEAYQRIRDTAVEVSRAHPIPYILLPAKQMLQIPSDVTRINKPKWANDEIPDKIKKKQSVKTASNSAGSLIPAGQTVDNKKKAHLGSDVDFTPQSGRPRAAKKNPALSDTHQAKIKDKRNLSMFSELTTNMLKHPERFQDLHELMNAAVQCIKYGLGLQRSSSSLISSSGHKLVTYYTAGMMDTPKLADLTLDLRKPSLFAKLAQKPLGAWISTQNYARLSKSIPSQFINAAQTKYFFVQSIFANDKPVAIIYADSGERGSDLTEEDYKYFKVLCKALSHSVEHFTTRKNTIKKSQFIKT